MSEQTRLRILIVDDEAPARARLKDLLADCAAEVPHEIVGEAGTARDALEVVTTPPAELTGRALLDEDFLRERGVTDFVPYRCDPEHEPPRVTGESMPKVGAAP